MMKLVVGSTGLQLHSFFKLVSVGFSICDFLLKNCRIAELEMSEEARPWEQEPTVAFFF
jgi:hypothetical protein